MVCTGMPGIGPPTLTLLLLLTMLIVGGKVAIWLTGRYCCCGA